MINGRFIGTDALQVAECSEHKVRNVIVAINTLHRTLCGNTKQKNTKTVSVSGLTETIIIPE